MSQSPFNFGSANPSGHHDSGPPPSGAPDPFAAPPAPPTPHGPFGGGEESTHRQPFAPGGGFEQAAPGTPFGDTGTASAPLTISRPPLPLLLIALVIAVVAAVVAGLFGQPLIAVICWVFAGPIAIGVIALYVTRDNNARAQGIYAAPRWARAFHVVTSVVCVLAVIVPAVRIAFWVGRL